MLITLNDPRLLGVVVCRAADHLFYNWQMQGWESPFDATKHLMQFTRVEAATGLFGTVQCADIGMVLLNRSDCAALIMTLDGQGQPEAVTDCWTLPCPVPFPVMGGFQRDFP
jgi:hypothetical protein